MTDHQPDPSANEAVLGELSAAFAGPEREGYDFDDPSIDRKLGIDDAVFDDAVFDDDGNDLDELDDVTVDGSQPATAIVIDDDDLPPTSYLGDDAANAPDTLDHSDSATGSIVIDDLDGPDLGADAVPKPRSSLDPRIRARRIAARRAEGRRRLKWVGLVVGLIVVIVGTIAVFASSMFDATDIRVQGAVYTDATMLEQVVASIKGTPVLLVDTAEVERSLETIPWVEAAKVTTSFPHTVTIDIRERRPVATFRGGDGKWRVIDGEGRVVAVIAGQPVAYMLITGQNPDTPAGDYAGVPYATAAQLVIVLPPEVRSRTTSVSLDSSTGNLALILDRGDRHSVLVRLGDGVGIADKLARLLNQIHTGLDKVVAIDVSTEEVGVVRG